MIEQLRKVIELIEPSNALTIFVFLVSVFIAIYLYFKTFFRLVYSTHRICRDGKDIKVWQNAETEFISRVLIYNNGRKTLTNAEIKQLEIYSTCEVIKDVRILKGNENLKTTIIANKINLDFDYLDSRNYFVLEIKHQGLIKVNGRVSESGKLLETETKFWFWFNILALMLVVFLWYYYMEIFLKSLHPHIFPAITDIFLVLCIGLIIRLIHALLFIPDNLSSKYLHSKDRNSNAFRKEF